MNVRVRYFAIVREIVGESHQNIELENGQTVKEMFSLLEKHNPDLKGMLERVSVAINYEYATTESILFEGAEVALIPPVSGG